MPRSGRWCAWRRACRAKASSGFTGCAIAAWSCGSWRLELQNPGTEAEDLPFEEFQSENLDRLLWLHLRLLYSDHALARFMRSTNEDEIQRDIADLEQRIAQTAGQTTPQQQKIRDVLIDNLATCKERQANLERAGRITNW